MRSSPRALLAFLGVLVGAVGCDHAAKQVALAALADTQSISLAGDSVRLELASNPGAFLGLGSELPEAIREVFFLWLVPLLLVSLCLYLVVRREASVPFFAGLGLVAGGGLANWLDRVLHGGLVTDFIVLSAGPWHTGVFNVADVAVVSGAVLLIVLSRHPRQQPA